MRKDLVSSAILLCIAAAYYAAATGIAQSTLEDAVGPRGFPAVLSTLLAILALAIAARAFARATASGRVEKAEKEAEADWSRALGMLALGALYIPLALLLGYGAALFLLLIAAMLYERMRPSWQMLVVAFGGAAFFWVLFERVLGVRQPEGLLLEWLLF